MKMHSKTGCARVIYALKKSGVHRHYSSLATLQSSFAHIPKQLRKQA